MDILVAQGLLAGTVHGRGNAQTLGEQIAAGHLAHGPADEAGAVVAGVAVLVGRLVRGRAVAGAAAPGVGRARGSLGRGEDLLADGGAGEEGAGGGGGQGGQEGDGGGGLHFVGSVGECIVTRVLG